MIEEMGIDFDRFTSVMDYGDDWGHLVHSVEYLIVLSVVEQAWKNQIAEDEVAGRLG